MEPILWIAGPCVPASLRSTPIRLCCCSHYTQSKPPEMGTGCLWAETSSSLRCG